MLGVFALLSAGLGPQVAVATGGVSLTQITTTSGCFTFNPSINADGTKIAFQSDCNLTGSDADGNDEVYRFDTTANALTQITASSGCDNASPSINADGTKIAFQSPCNLTGSDADGNADIYRFDTTVNAFTQVTTSSACTNRNPRISADGMKVAFQSDCNLTGSDADGNIEIYHFDIGTSTLTQVTASSSCTNQAPAISADGTTIAFQSNCNLTGSNADGNNEIYRFDTTTSTLTQITVSSGCINGDVSINADGTRIAFTSNCNLTGSDADGSFEIYRFDTTTHTLNQLTTTSGCDSDLPSINADGTKIAFRTNCNFTGSDADGNDELYRVDTITNTLTPVTTSSGCSNDTPSINADGTKIAFQSDCNLTGSNAGGDGEIFLARLTSPAQAAPALSPWGLLSVAALLMFVGCWRSRRTRARVR
jgi:Tol biopolymer transport system component